MAVNDAGQTGTNVGSGRAHADDKPRHIGGNHEYLRRYALLWAWIAVIAIFGIMRPAQYLSLGTAGAVFGTNVVLLFTALSVLPVFAAGEFDLSIAGNLGVSLVLFGWLNAIQHVNAGLAIVIVLIFGVLVGAINATLVVGVGVESLIVTLGMGTALGGVAFAISPQTVGGISPSLVRAMSADLLGLPAAFFYALALVVLLWYYLTFRATGRYLYFTGSGREVARLTGIATRKLIVGSFMFSGIGASFAGVVLAGTLGSADPNVGPAYLLPVFAAVFLGSTAVQPGRFNAWGTFIAVYFLASGIAGLQLFGLSGWVSDVFYGTSLAVGVTLARLAARGSS